MQFTLCICSLGAVGPGRCLLQNSGTDPRVRPSGPCVEEVQLKGVGGFISSAKYCLSECLHEQKNSELPSLSLANQFLNFPTPCGGYFLPQGWSRINEAAGQVGGRGSGSELAESSLQSSPFSFSPAIALTQSPSSFAPSRHQPPCLHSLRAAP